MKLGTETGSLVNHIHSRCGALDPVVGLGATILGWTDRHAGTIVEVTDKSFTVQLDNAKRTDDNFMSDCQSYEYTANPNGARITFKRVTRGKAKGQWRENGRKDGGGVLIGQRQHYYDYSF